MMVHLKSKYYGINTMVMATSIEHASKVLRGCIEKDGIPSSQWEGGKLVDKKNKKIGFIHYNGRFEPIAAKSTLANVLPNDCFIL